MVPRLWHRPGPVPAYIGLQLLNHRFNKKTDDRGLPAHLGPTVEVRRPTAPVSWEANQIHGCLLPPVLFPGPLPPLYRGCTKLVKRVDVHLLASVVLATERQLGELLPAGWQPAFLSLHIHDFLHFLQDTGQPWSTRETRGSVRQSGPD